MATDEHYSVARRACACYGASTDYSHSVRTIGYKNLSKSARIDASSDGAYSYRWGLQITMQKQPYVFLRLIRILAVSDRSPLVHCRVMRLHNDLL